jgi:hypothetical protein
MVELPRHAGEPAAMSARSFAQVFTMSFDISDMSGERSFAPKVCIVVRRLSRVESAKSMLLISSRSH